MPERHVEEDREQCPHSGLFRKLAPQPRRLQHAAMPANQLCDFDEALRRRPARPPASTTHATDLPINRGRRLISRGVWRNGNLGFCRSAGTELSVAPCR